MGRMVAAGWESSRQPLTKVRDVRDRSCPDTALAACAQMSPLSEVRPVLLRKAQSLLSF